MKFDAISEVPAVGVIELNEEHYNIAQGSTTVPT